MTRILAPALLACIVVLGTAAAGSGDGDWLLTVRYPDGMDVPICAKSARTCHEAQEAIDKGRWLSELPRGITTSCRLSPGCFDDRSLCIPGYSGTRPEGYC